MRSAIGRIFDLIEVLCHVGAQFGKADDFHDCGLLYEYTYIGRLDKIGKHYPSFSARTPAAIIAPAM